MLDFTSPSVYIPTTFVLLIIVFAVIFAKDAKRIIRRSTKGFPYHDEIDLSMGYIERNILDNGRFVYRKNVDTEIEYDNNIYNSLRHAGTLYSMCLYEKCTSDTKYRRSRLLASKYFVKKYIKKVSEGKYGIISIPEEERINIKIAKSGAAGIALCALVSLYDEKLIKLDLLQGLGEFLLSMQKDDGNIYAYYDFESKTINKEAEAIYYPGEAAAGWMSLYEIDPQEIWVDAARKTLLYLVKSQKGNEEFVFDHWAIFAIEKLLYYKLLSEEDEQTLKNYVELMIIPLLTVQITNPKNVYYGAFKDNIRPCSIGAIMEGLGSAYFCTDSKQLKTIIYKSLALGCMFLSRVQVKTGLNAGGLPNSANWVKPGVTPNASIIRIDNVQHVVSAWLKFQNVLRAMNKF